MINRELLILAELKRAIERRDGRSMQKLLKVFADKLRRGEPIEPPIASMIADRLELIASTPASANRFFWPDVRVKTSMLTEQIETFLQVEDRMKELESLPTGKQFGSLREQAMFDVSEDTGIELETVKSRYRVAKAYISSSNSEIKQRLTLSGDLENSGES